MSATPSGASKRKKKKLDEREARRRRGKFNEKAWREKFTALGPCPVSAADRLAWIGRYAGLALEYCAADPGPPPEQTREQMARLIPQAVKAFDPAAVAEDLRAFKDALDGSKEDDGDEEHPRDESGTSKPPTLC